MPTRARRWKRSASCAQGWPSQKPSSDGSLQLRQTRGRKSAKHPPGRDDDGDSSIHVDFLAADSHGLSGRLGLTVAPASGGPAQPPVRTALVRDDLLHLRDFHGAKVLVTLLEAFEIGSSRSPSRRRLRRSYGSGASGFPSRTCRYRRTWKARGPRERHRRPHVARRHGRGPLPGRAGRSGTTAVCVLVARGRSASEAIRMVRSAAGRGRGRGPGGVRWSAASFPCVRFLSEVRHERKNCPIHRK